MSAASLIAVGDELLAGLHPDLNSPELARRLARLGIGVAGIRVVPDDEAAIAGAVRSARQEARLVLVTGGLGPTLDDVTRHGVARALGLALEEDPEARAGLARWFERRGVSMPAANLRQALFPKGAAIVPNRVGTAPGFRVADERGELFALPGPPAEMRVVFEEEVEPRLVAAGLATPPVAERRFHLCGLSESVFAERAGPWMDREAPLLMGCSVKRGVLSVVVRDRAGDEVALEALAVEFRERFAPWIFSEEQPEVERVLGARLLATGTRVAVAESCTGGLVSGLLTRVPGISAVFSRGFVVYSDEAKVAELGVAPETLEGHGAVSPEVARELARGAARVAGAALGIGVTGVAGPEGGTPEKPVGLVWFGTWLAGEAGEDGAGAAASERRFPPGERDWIRALAARHALFLALRRLEAAAGVPGSVPAAH